MQGGVIPFPLIWERDSLFYSFSLERDIRKPDEITVIQITPAMTT
ncbi:hypothetical protein HMPREF0766_13745 [Sphingobacterium spiritivorum ATCC 33861]|uniref:Uncharacterized protein n=1 Tax=Sphingobacterium spiritivorum ATCC 33861 TaxID=525373 RepID=D7VRZ1_SPHSI|nr:hypothetical protein HMPREF0766_13745 [Sphingobacterium spiritivorum ATCC 33861]